MSMARVRSKLALRWGIDQLRDKGSLRMWTFTLPVVLDIPVACCRWSDLCHALVSEAGFSGVRVFELHKSHGLHVHVITNQYYSVSRFRAIALRFGWGRIHVQRCNKEPYYVAKYVSKGFRDGCFIGRRLWASFGECRGYLTKCRDVVIETAKGSAFRSIEKREWLRRYRADVGGHLRGANYSRYIREGFEELHKWVCVPVADAALAAAVTG